MPVAGLREKATPVALLSLKLPNTIAWTVTAVPWRPVMRFSSRYFTARGVFQDLQAGRWIRSGNRVLSGP